MFFAQMRKYSRRFQEMHPEILHTCFASLCRPVNEEFFVCFVFHLKIWDFFPQDPNIPKKTPKYLSKKEEKPPFVDRLTGAHCTRVQNATIYLPKAASTSDSG